MARNSKRQSRRPKGQGTEWQDTKAKRWRWRITVDGHDHYVSDPDRQRAKGKFTALVERLHKGLDLDGARQPLHAYLSAWLATTIRRDVKTTTYHDYIKRCKIYIIPTLGDYALSALTPQLIRDWANAVRDNYAHSSAKQVLEILTRALDQAVNDHLLDFNPARAVKPPRKRPDETAIDDAEEGQQSLTPDQEQSLLDAVRRTDRHHTRSAAARSTGLYVLYVIALRLGLRRGELLGMRWRDVDLDGGVLHIRQQINAENHITTPKSPKARRAIPLTDDLIQLLREHKLQLGPLGRAYVFPDAHGDHRKPRALNKHFERASARAALTGFTLHDLRRTAITRWREKGIDLEVAAALAGHSTIKITAEIYSDSTMDRKRSAMEKLG